VGSIRVTPSANTTTPTGLNVFSFQNNGVTVSEAGVSAASAGTAYRVFAESNGSMQTGLAIANTSPQATTVVVEVKNLDGNTGLIGTVSIPGYGQKALCLNQIPGIQTRLTPC